MSERAVVNALVFDVSGRLLLVRNEHWGGLFALPTRRADPNSDSLTAAAIDAVRRDTGLSLPHAAASHLVYVGMVGESGRAGEPTACQQWAAHVDPGERLFLSGSQFRFQDYDSIRAATDVSGTTKDVADAVIADQEAVVAVLTRPGRRQTEYLVLWNDRYEGYFFPTGRVPQEVKPHVAAGQVVRAELGFPGPVPADLRAEVPNVHFSQRWYGRRRNYRFHVVAVELPGWDLHRPLGPLDRALRRRESLRTPPEWASDRPGWWWRWLTADQLRTPPPGVRFTEMMPTLVPSVLAVIPSEASSLRVSEGGIAAIRQTGRDGEPEWLALWNETSNAFFMIGRHRVGNESFEECIAREVGEELEIDAGMFVVGPRLPVPPYIALSRSARVYTEYEPHLYEVTLTETGRAAVAAAEGQLRLRWLPAAEIRARETTDGRTVSETVELLLRLSGQLPP